MQYELFYLVGEKNEANLATIREEVSQLLISEKATLLEPELTEKRKLAYEIKHQNRGTYVTRRFELPEVDFWADATNAEKEFGIESITKRLNLTNTVLRFMIVKTSELPELGAKEKRQQQEQKESKGFKKPEARPAREQRRPTPAAPIKETKAVKEEVAKKEVKEVKEEKEVEAKEVKKPTAEKPAAKKAAAEKKEAKDIDKQLEELLNI